MKPVAILRRGLGILCRVAPVRFWTGGKAGDRLRSVVYHHVAEKENAFTAGLRVTMHPDDFDRHLKFFSREYDPISFSDLLSPGRLPRKPLLVTFDDAYGSVARTAYPIAKTYSVPLTFFVNSDQVDGKSVSFGHIVAAVGNVYGADRIREIPGITGSFSNVREFLGTTLPDMTRAGRERLQTVLLDLAEARQIPLQDARQLYISATELAELADRGVEIGNHTASHVYCRNLEPAEIEHEIIGAGERLREITGRPVKVFSFPYGSPADAAPPVLAALRERGYQGAVFVSAAANPQPADPWNIGRVSPKGRQTRELVLQMEVIPRLLSYGYMKLFL